VPKSVATMGKLREKLICPATSMKPSSMWNDTVLAIGAQISSDNGKIGRETYLPSDNDEVPLIATHPYHSQQRSNSHAVATPYSLFLAHSVEDMCLLCWPVSFSPSQCSSELPQRRPSLWLTPRPLPRVPPTAPRRPLAVCLSNPFTATQIPAGAR
jgi:hypothetical protein